MDYSQFARWVSFLGHTFPPFDELASELNQFACLLCGDKSSSNVNVCRHNLFKSGKCSDDLLPSACDSLSKHIERANSHVFYVGTSHHQMSTYAGIIYSNRASVPTTYCLQPVTVYQNTLKEPISSQLCGFSVWLLSNLFPLQLTTGGRLTMGN